MVGSHVPNFLFFFAPLELTGVELLPSIRRCSPAEGAERCSCQSPGDGKNPRLIMPRPPVWAADGSVQ